MRPYLEKTQHQKRAGGVTQGIGPKFKSQYYKKEKRKSFCRYELILNKRKSKFQNLFI
jgi:hypothetical protein